jgi:hypothetical protein
MKLIVVNLATCFALGWLAMAPQEPQTLTVTVTPEQAAALQARLVVENAAIEAANARLAARQVPCEQRGDDGQPVCPEPRALLTLATLVQARLHERLEADVRWHRAQLAEQIRELSDEDKAAIQAILDAARKRGGGL